MECVRSECLNLYLCLRKKDLEANRNLCVFYQFTLRNWIFAHFLEEICIKEKKKKSEYYFESSFRNLPCPLEKNVPNLVQKTIGETYVKFVYVNSPEDNYHITYKKHGHVYFEYVFQTNNPGVICSMKPDDVTTPCSFNIGIDLKK